MQLTTVFAPELDALPAGERQTVLAAADVVVSWESLDLMHNDQGLPIDQVEAAMRGGLARLLGPTTATSAPDAGVRTVR